MTGLRFERSEVMPSKCPRRAILNALERARILMPDRNHGITPVGVNGERILAAACNRTLAIATAHIEGRHDEVIREARLFLPPIIEPELGKFGALLLDIEAVLDIDLQDLLRKAAVMAVLREAHLELRQGLEAAHLSAHLRHIATAIQLRDALPS